jgi:hypothetical protein
MDFAAQHLGPSGVVLVDIVVVISGSALIALAVFVAVVVLFAVIALFAVVARIAAVAFIAVTVPIAWVIIFIIGIVVITANTSFAVFFPVFELQQASLCLPALLELLDLFLIIDSEPLAPPR